MGDILDIDPKDIDERTRRDTLEAWDSLKHITLCAALEEEFQISLDVSEIESMLTYRDVVRVLRAKL